MTDTFKSHTRGLTSPPEHGGAITPSNQTLAVVTRALFVGQAGDLAVRMLGGEAIVLSNVPAGTLLPLRVDRVLPATTAGAIVGLW
ncbi:hypothetical protein [uncultured Amaricoccus sp.]|uniref:spike base protein, RCAP_Rcc01079 family n=1 Tax=uncultured Amaricoccus sp. TaxID=339341 RepID=UPI00260228E7|nr:hypothetical protein [uncultured Amaricoccus sp.]